jgi:hypothetical protein
VGIRHEYAHYLDRFGATVPLRDVLAIEDRPWVALRHDVDHDLDIALEMAAFEAKRGIASTYFLLHTAAYYEQDRFWSKVAQLVDYGHEVGLHLNVLTDWVRGAIDDPRSETERLIAAYRDRDIELQGVSAHGDRACYEHGFINYWCFQELRPEDPAAREHGRSAEGIPVVETAFQVPYPSDHRLVRADGAAFDLWSLSMAELGVDYEASHLPYDRYFSDSGGAFTRSTDPLDEGFGDDASQVLMHPIHWVEPSASTFVLSTARVGSTWFARQLDASSTIAVHEHALNHEIDGGSVVPRKRTGSGFASLQYQHDEVIGLLAHVREWRDSLQRDVVEANVYLAHVLPELAATFPDARAVQLVRHPADVVASIRQRGWYETAEDDRHPSWGLPHWEDLSPFERCCWYVRFTNDHLQTLGLPVVRIEDVTASVDTFVAVAERLGVSVHRTLLAEFDEVINANPDPAAAWADEEQRQFDDICGPLVRRHGYDGATPDPAPDVSWEPSRLADVVRIPSVPTTTIAFDGVSDRMIEVGFARDQDTLRPLGDRHAYVLLGGGAWAEARDGAGWRADPNLRFSGRLDIDMSGRGMPNLFLLEFDGDGRKMSQRRLTEVSVFPEFSFRCVAGSVRFNLAIHCDKARLPEALRVRDFRLDGVPITSPGSSN